MRRRRDHNTKQTETKTKANNFVFRPIRKIENHLLNRNSNTQTRIFVFIEFFVKPIGIQLTHYMPAMQ